MIDMLKWIKEKRATCVPEPIMAKVKTVEPSRIEVQRAMIERVKIFKD